MKQKYDIALIGLGVMGQSLARNIASKKYRVLTYNRTTKVAADFIKTYGNDHLSYEKELKNLVKNLESPRKIIIMVKAGEAVDLVIQELLPLLSKGDIVIDAGNSLYSDSIRRSAELEKKGLHFVGMGVSGGEEGALRGPSIMPGGSKESWKALSPILKKIAAKDFSGKPCVTHVGADGAGHYVKMVHNGIEYGIMQMMAEAYQVLRMVYGLKADKIAEIFRKFNQGRLKSYLFEISVPILERKDDLKKGYLIDSILDKAGQKGTGRWVAIDALQRGATLPTITMAVFARSVSAQKEDRMQLSKLFKKPKTQAKVPLSKFTELLESALYAGMISSYAQGFELIALAAREQNWKINFAEVTRIWEGGCIIRADMLNFLHKAFMQAKGKPVHLFTIKEIRAALQKELKAWRQVVAQGAEMGIGMPCLGSSLTYFEDITSEKLPANFIQGQRDYFGAHTYERTDKKGVFHTPWSNLDL
ncbi:MAG: NADP-dependent phosphogluconate dehydrogenase [Candidatus Peregrinibacteria bacterium]|nr:NADP-dependent phosphogluconate dehydrogenase [Candidatus Peregrinibacteria bacterium]